MPDSIPASVGLSDAHSEGLTEPRPAPIDFSHLNRYTLGDLELQREVLELFAGQLASSLDDLHAAQTAEAWLRAAHTLKGSAHAVGATALATAMQDAETLPDASDASCRRAALTRIEAEAREVAAFLNSERP